MRCGYRLTFKEHIVALCLKHRITLYETAKEETECVSSRKARRIIVLPIINYRAYILALHEVFHIVNPCPIKTLDKEMAAWKGAKSAAILWTKEADLIVFECLKSYIEYYKGDNRVKVSKEFRRFIKSLI